MRAWETGGDFQAQIQQDSEVRRYLNPEQLEAVFSLERQLKYVDQIFDRVFGSNH